MSREGDHFQVVAQVLSSLLTVVRARDLEAAQVQAVEKSARTTADPRIACIEAAREDACACVLLVKTPGASRQLHHSEDHIERLTDRLGADDRQARLKRAVRAAGSLNL